MSTHRPIIVAGALTAFVVLTVLGVGTRLGAFGLGDPAAAESVAQAVPNPASNTDAVNTAAIEQDRSWSREGEDGYEHEDDDHDYRGQERSSRFAKLGDDGQGRNRTGERN